MESRTEVMKQNAQRIKTICAYMAVLDPSDFETMARLEAKLKNARDFVRGRRAPSVAIQESLPALTEAKAKLEKSSAHLATAQDHHKRAVAEVARCKEEHTAAKRMNGTPLQRRQQQKE